MYRTPVIINYLKAIVMEKLLKIEGKNCSKYPNALHAQFHNRMHALIAIYTFEIYFAKRSPVYMCRKYDYLYTLRKDNEIILGKAKSR